MGDYASSGPFQVDPDLANRLAAAKEAVWFRIGVLQSTMNDRERALNAFERVLAVNPGNVRAMTQAGAVLAKKECYPQAVAYLQRAISADAACGEAWAVLAHCYVMTDDLQKAYQAYQNALSHLPNPRDPNLWYGIGLLYDRYGSLDNALEAFLAVLSISPQFERADEVCFCIGIIYKEQQNFDEALRYFNKVVVAANPPPPLTRADGWYQIGHVNELKRDIPAALEMYKQALAENPKHPKTLQNYGWLEHQHNNNSTEAIRLLKLSADLDSNDGQTWYLLGRVFMALREFRQAYDAYQQAVYRDGGNATFWCSIGVLYYQMNQYRDAMDAYSRAIRLNPYVSEVWYDLGTLYESCGQNADAIDAYRRAAELAPDNTQITARLGVLENSMNPAVHPQQVASQAQPSASQPTSQAQPHQLPHDIHNSNQAHMPPQLNPVRSRSITDPMQQLQQPSTQDSKIPQQQPSLHPSQLHHGQHMSSQQIGLGQGPGTATAGSLPLPHRSGQLNMAPIPSLQPSSIPPGERRPTENGGFPPESRGNVPLPLSSMQLPSPQSTVGGNHISSMMSQPLPAPRVSQGGSSQPHMSVLSPPALHSRPNDPVSPSRHPSFSHSQLQPLASSGPQEHQPRAPLSHISPIETPQHGLRAMNGQGHSLQRDGQSHQRTEASEGAPMHPLRVHRQLLTRMPSSDPIPAPQQDQHPSSSQTPNTLPQIQSLPQMQPLSQLYDPPTYKKPEEHATLASSERANTNATTSDALDKTHHAGADGAGRKSLDGDERAGPPRLPALQKTERENDSSTRSKPTGQEQPAPSQPTYQASLPAPHRDEPVAPPKEPSGDARAGPPPAPRSMSMREITQPEPGYPERSTEGDRKVSPDLADQTRDEPQSSEDKQGHRMSTSSDRLPSLRPLPGTSAVKGSEHESRGESKPIHSLPTPSLSLPSSNALPSIRKDSEEKPLSSPSPPAHSGLGTTSALETGGPSLPPLSARNQGSHVPDSKDGPMQSAPLTHGASSLTKFGKGIGRTPVTPVSNAVTASPLPSPLPTRKNVSSTATIHGPRSPRLSKPSNAPPFKSVPVAPSTSNYPGPIESVPSPSSLPVLPALSSHPSREEDEDASSPPGKTEQENTHSERGKQLHSRTKEVEKDAKGTESSARKPEDPLANRPIFGMLRSAPAPIASSEKPSAEKDEQMRSAVAKPISKTQPENHTPSKRESCNKDEVGRIAKRPRLQDSERDNGGKGVGFEATEKPEKMDSKDIATEEEDGRGSKRGLPPVGNQDASSVKDAKPDAIQRSKSPPSDGERRHAEDGMKRSGDQDKPKGTTTSDDAELPRLTNPVPKLSSPLPLSGNTPLPSFRSERMNITASRSGSGAAPGKSGGSESTSRGPLPFLRSAPVSSISPNLKSPSVAGRGSGDRVELNSEGRNLKRVEEDRTGSLSPPRKESRETGGEDQVANGGNQKSNEKTSEREGRRSSDVAGKDDKATSRPEVHGTAT